MRQSKFKIGINILCGMVLWINSVVPAATENHLLHPVSIQSVTIEDAFWSPRLNTWSQVTVPDVLNKFENGGAFRNFDRAAGLLEGKHEGPPWHDGLIYETILGISDFLVYHPDKEIENRLDQYIERIAAAQAKDPDGYVMTYTQLDEPNHRWGLNGGYERWQHDVYNAGALVEAGVHYYRATGKVKLLEVAVRMANLMCDVMGPSPKKNIVPSHSLPEEALVKLYVLFHENPALKGKLSVAVNERRYLDLAEFWLENRGNHCGKPTEQQWNEDEPGCQSWIRSQQYGDSRPSWGPYAQDHKSIFQQETLEGHAVRATLMCTGLTAAARVNGRDDYTAAAKRLWDNMAGKRMHITGGMGAFAHDEKFGADYVLPNDAYLETCAAIGAGFYHHNMNLLFGDAKYVDELERVLYNGVLNGVSLSGNQYYYQNPLSTKNYHRWAWHGCPCCPPMFLKFISAMPGYIYAHDNDGLYINLFVGSQAECSIKDNLVTVRQKTDYPWKGAISLTLEPKEDAEFAVHIRIPGWANGVENPSGLYKSDLKSKITLKVNGKEIESPRITKGYASIQRLWKKGDTIELELPVAPRRIYAHPEVKADNGKVALQSGPLVYCFEQLDNPNMTSLALGTDLSLQLDYQSGLFGGINLIKGRAFSRQQTGPAKEVEFTAIPFFCQDNREGGGTIEVWLPER
ncbi:MAG: beta-L-arabinofuranosidase domain-containing protein [Anaerohalosphaeraceae bacterium]